MSYFAAAVVRDADGWSAAEVSLAEVADIEDVADRLRDVRPDADVSLLFIESDDSYLVILRLDHGEDLRVFGSDVAFAEESRLGALLLGEVGVPVIDLPVVDLASAEADDDAGDAGPEAASAVDADPTGDADLLADLGVPAAKLLALCTHEGMLPSDITAEVCQAIGCGDEIEELREA
ncbi:MAG TPA: tRNA adenosine deaminase-associated protein [Micromonosporaceae bacterium]